MDTEHIAQALFGAVLAEITNEVFFVAAELTLLYYLL